YVLYIVFHLLYHSLLSSSSMLFSSLLFSFFLRLPFLFPFFFLMLPPPPRSTLFPYTTLFRSGRLLPRERIRRLLDPGSPFLEIGALAAFAMYDDDAPAAGLIAGVGLVEGRYVMIVCNDSTVKGGTYYPMTVKKHL